MLEGNSFRVVACAYKQAVVCRNPSGLELGKNKIIFLGGVSQFLLVNPSLISGGINVNCTVNDTSYPLVLRLVLRLTL
jgi:hypothetical protein